MQRGRKTRIDLETAQILYDSGLTLKQVAKKYDTCASNLRKRFLTANIKTRTYSEAFKGRTFSEETKEKIGRANSIALKGHKPHNYIDGRSKKKSPYIYGDDWDMVRYLVYLRDCFCCQHCGAKPKKICLDVHHKIPFLISNDNSIANLITLCRSCHRREEAVCRKKYSGGDSCGRT